MGINSLAVPLKAIKTKYKQKHTNTLDVFFYQEKSFAFRYSVHDQVLYEKTSVSKWVNSDYEF